MRNFPTVTRVQFTPARKGDRDSGLLGYVVVELDDMLEFDGFTLRRTTLGEHRISFPARKDGHGRHHAIVRPVRAEARQSIEQQILAELRRQGVLP